MRTNRLGTDAAVRLAAALWAAGALAVSGAAVASAAPGWATGAQFQKRLGWPVGVTWSANPLRQALAGLSERQQVAILIDRRVDPSQAIDLSVQDVPLETLLATVARDRGLGVSLFEPVVYLGPPEAASRLRTIAALRTEEAKRLPGGAPAKFLQARPLAWDDFAVPRELLAQLAREGRIQLAGLEQVPHDLWAAADLPPLTLVERLTLVLVQFDLTFQVGADGTTVSLVPVPDDVAMVRSYPGGRQPQAVAERYAALLPAARVKVIGNQVYVKGRLEEHEQITSPRRPSEHVTPAPAASLERTHIDHLAVRDSVGRILRKVATQLNIELRIDEQALQKAGISLEQRIAVTVDNVSVDELLREIVRPAGLSFQRRGTVVEIGPAR